MTAACASHVANNHCHSLYAEMAGAKTAANYQTPLFLAASASAEFLADIGLCPLEAVKVAFSPTTLHSAAKAVKEHVA
jgi:hypothetical protein